MKNNLEPKFSRSCPTCGKILHCKTQWHLNSANNINSECKECADKRKKEEGYSKPKYDYNNFFDEVVKKYFYICPSCNQKIYVAGKPGVRQAIDKNCICKECINKNEERNNKISIKVKELMNDPESIFNTPDMIKRRNENLNTTENRKQSSERMKVLMNDPNSNIRKRLRTPEVKEKVSKGIKQAWADPNSAFNDPEHKKVVSDAIKKAWAEDEYRNSAEYKLELTKRLVENPAFQTKISKGERELFHLIERYGFILNNFKVKIDRSYPDIIHKNKKIIVEYYGDFWHANPTIEKYKNDDTIISLPYNKTTTAGKIRKRDDDRKTKLETFGYVVYVVWEKEFKIADNRQKILQDIENLVLTH